MRILFFYNGGLERLFLWLVVTALDYKAGDLGSIPGSGRTIY